MLSMRLPANTMKAMTFYNTLESFSFGSSNYFNTIAFGKYVNSEGFTNILFYFAIAYFLNKSFRGGISFCKVIHFCFDGVFFILITKCYLESIITVSFNGFLL